jgi:ectoine hydroxylase-related dioxygenase (phytanoyl-CoA dioxygenase family)
LYRRPDRHLIDDFNRQGIAVIRNLIDADQRIALRHACQALLASTETRGRDRGADGKDGFRGCVNLLDAVLPLVANPRILPSIVALLSTNIRLLSSHLIALPSIPPGATRTIRTTKRPGWHRDLYGVASDLGHQNVPRMAIKCAYYLTDPAPACGVTMFLPGSHLLTELPHIAPGTLDPLGAFTPDLGPCDAVLFENRTWHAGGINTSGHPRLALMMQYGYRWLAPVDDPATDLLQRSDLSSIERQLLGAADRAPDGSLAKGVGSAPLRALRSQIDDGMATDDAIDMRSPGPSGDNQTDVREPQNAR